MITEDYVSFDTAKLLKEKGFNEETQFIYDPNGIPDRLLENIWEWRHCVDTLGMLAAPTLQMAMKWLRKVHNIYIDILTYTTGNDIQFRWVGYEKGRLFSQEEGKTIYFDSYEQAIEEAIKYCLENII